MRGRVIVVPGVAVRRYAVKPVDRLRQAGYEVDLRPGLSWQGVPMDTADYGRELGHEIVAAGERVDVLVGPSAGTQAAAVPPRPPRWSDTWCWSARPWIRTAATFPRCSRSSSNRVRTSRSTFSRRCCRTGRGRDRVASCAGSTRRSNWLWRMCSAR